MAKHLVAVRSPTRHPRRKLAKAISKNVKAHAQRIGLVVWAANNLQVNLQATFCSLVDRNYQVGNEVWHSMKSDDGQRMALAAIATAKLPAKSKILANLLWTVDIAGKLAGFRNDAVHTATTLQANRKDGWYVVPSEDWGQPKRVARLQRVGSAKLFNALLGDLNQLTEYSHFLSVKIGIDESIPLPRRPALRVFPLLGQALPTSRSRKKHRPKCPSQPAT